MTFFWFYLRIIINTGNIYVEHSIFQIEFEIEFSLVWILDLIIKYVM